MTIREALDRRIRFVRLPHWVPFASIELPLLPDGGYGPWATVYDGGVPEGIKVLIFTLTKDIDDRYEEVSPDPPKVKP